MNNRIDACFVELHRQGRCALIPFITAGDPHPDWTVPIMRALVAAGADVLELGVPFSDPVADGPVIQAASERAIGRGVSLRSVLDTVRQFRRDDAVTPVVLMGYMNPLERYGCAAFVRDAADAGVDGVLLVDCPPEESADLDGLLREHGIHSIFLAAPTTTPERLGLIAGRARGYLYYVSFKGVTGADRLEEARIEGPIAAVRERTELPVAVGFGVKGPDSAAAIARFADGVVIGSALVAALAEAGDVGEAVRLAAGFLAPVRAAMDNEAA